MNEDEMRTYEDEVLLRWFKLAQEFLRDGKVDEVIDSMDIMISALE